MSTYVTRPVGEIFEYCKLKLQVIEKLSCEGCYFCGDEHCLNFVSDTGYCGESARNDNKNVIFKRISK